ncbi:MAG: hypothetical protein MMC33_001267 [Icmadophila ericetorum]|nr:hypothetical protein [Icmadophila ericetorum]
MHISFYTLALAALAALPIFALPTTYTNATTPPCSTTLNSTLPQCFNLQITNTGTDIDGILVGLFHDLTSTIGTAKNTGMEPGIFWLEPHTSILRTTHAGDGQARRISTEQWDLDESINAWYTVWLTNKWKDTGTSICKFVQGSKSQVLSCEENIGGTIYRAFGVMSVPDGVGLPNPLLLYVTVNQTMPLDLVVVPIID